MDKKSRKKAVPKKYMKYAGLAATLFLLMFAAYYLGNLLDKQLEFDKPYAGLLCLVVVMAGYFYKIVKDLS